MLRSKIVKMTQNSWLEYLFGVLLAVVVLYLSVDLVRNFENYDTITIISRLIALTMGPIGILMVFAREKAEKIPGIPEQKD
jgi:uncharacterized membrane protein YfcA